MASTPMPPAPAPEVPQQPALSEGARIINTFMAPSKTFTDIRRNASWWAPFVVIAVATCILAFAAGQKVGFDQIQENRLRQAPKQAEKLEQLKQQNPQAYDRQMAISAKITSVTAYVAPVFMLIVFVVIAAVLMATFNFGMGGDVSFKTILAVVVYSHLPAVIKSLLAVITLYAGASPEAFTMENPLASNLSILSEPGKLLYTAGSGIDLFTIWSLILTGIGLSCVTKFKRGTTFAVVFGWWAVVFLLGLGVAAAFM